MGGGGGGVTDEGFEKVGDGAEKVKIKFFCFSSLILGGVSSSVGSTCGVNQSSGEDASR